MMAEAIVEKRATRRFSVLLPISVDRGNESLHYRTRDVSAGGVSFYSAMPIPKFSDISFVMTLPPEVTLTEGIDIRCHAHVVRVERDGIGFCIAAAIDRYEYLGGS
jgi:PilZ domain